MKTLLVFAILVGGPLFYLWQHAHSFRLHQRIAQLQEQRQRTKEVCDSLAACLDNLASRFTLEQHGAAIGLRPRIDRAPLLVAQAQANPSRKAPTPGAASRPPDSASVRPAGAPAGVASQTTQSTRAEERKGTGPRTPARPMGSQPPARGGL